MYSAHRTKLIAIPEKSTELEKLLSSFFLFFLGKFLNYANLVLIFNRKSLVMAARSGGLAGKYHIFTSISPTSALSKYMNFIFLLIVVLSIEELYQQLKKLFLSTINFIRGI